MSRRAARTIGWTLLVIVLCAMEPAHRLKDKEEGHANTHATVSLTDADIIKIALNVISIVAAVMVQPWVIVTLAFLHLFSVFIQLPDVKVYAAAQLLALMLLATYRTEIQNWINPPE